MISTPWLSWTVGILGSASCLLWFLSFLRVLQQSRWALIAEREKAPLPERWPRLTVIVPACNEVHTLEPALATLRAQTYPELEILLVDDRSSDGTGALVDRLAGEDPRVTPIHIHELPPGWLGKVHALHMASQAARGDWLLFTDADVHFAPGALEGAVALAQDRDLDLLTFPPDVSSQSLPVNVVLSAFWIGAIMRTDYVRCLDPKRPDAFGVGAFNLVRREGLERSEGFEWLRMEINDDRGLGLAVKKAGGRIGLMFSERWVKVSWYENLWALLRGMSKNGPAMFGQFNMLRGLAGMALLATILAAPPAMLLLQPSWIWAPPLVVYALWVGMGISILRRVKSSPWPVLLWPIGFAFFLVVGAYSLWRVWRRGGIEWRGTLYSTAELRKGLRVQG